jgi:uncharacterized protein (TIGR02444 family)
VTPWAFALEVYARPEVERACLALQDDHGQCVGLLLWRLWASREGLEVEALAGRAAELARRAEREVLGPLRVVRRRLKGEPQLREAVFTAELAAERWLIEGLAALGQERARAPEVRDEALALGALNRMVEAWGASAPADLLAKLARAC